MEMRRKASMGGTAKPSAPPDALILEYPTGWLNRSESRSVIAWYQQKYANDTTGTRHKIQSLTSTMVNICDQRQSTPWFWEDDTPLAHNHIIIAYLGRKIPHYAKMVAKICATTSRFGGRIACTKRIGGELEEQLETIQYCRSKYGAKQIKSKLDFIVQSAKSIGCYCGNESFQRPKRDLDFSTLRDSSNDVLHKPGQGWNLEPIAFWLPEVVAPLLFTRVMGAARNSKGTSALFKPRVVMYYGKSQGDPGEAFGTVGPIEHELHHLIEMVRLFRFDEF